MTSRAVSVLIVISFIPLLISSCTTQMTLEEAKKVTITSTEKSFVPPPRKANDINDLLIKKGVFESKATDALKKTAEMQPPSGADDATLKKFYEERGIAAYQLVRYNQALEDLRKAYGYPQQAGGSRYELAMYLSFSEAEFGNFKKAIDILEDEIQKHPNPWAAYSFLTQLHAYTGDVESARKTNDMCEKVCSDFRQKYPRSVWLSNCQAQIDRSNGFLLQAEGKLDQAEGPLRRYADYWASQKNTRPRDAIMMRTFLLSNLIQQNKLLEAELETRKALDESIDYTGKNSVLTGRILTYFVNIIRLQGRLQEANALSEETIKIFEASQTSFDSSVVCNARIVQGNILFEQDNHDGATKVYDQVKLDMKDNQYIFDKYFLYNLNIMVSLIRAGRAEEALKRLSPVYESNRKIYGDESYATAEALGVRGMANTSMGRDKEAYHDFSLALATLLKRNLGQITAPDQRKRVAMIYESYLDLLSRIHGTRLERQFKIKADEESYKVVNALSGYALTRAVGESTARAAAAYDPDLTDLVRREQDAQKEMYVLQETISELLAAPPDEVTIKGIKESRARIEALQRARSAIQGEIEKKFPKYADYMNPPLPSVELTKQNLRSGEAILSIYTTDDKTYIWAIPQIGDVRFAVSPQGKKELTGIVVKLRRSVDSNAMVLGDLPDFDTSLAYQLYSGLIKPVEGGLKNATDILAVVRGPLSQLPLATLPTAPVSLISEGNLLFSKYRNVPWLIRRASITLLPSVSSLITLRTLPDGDPKRKAFAGFGDPIFSKDQLTMQETEKSRKTTQLASRAIPVQIRGVRITEKGNIDNKQISSLQLANLNRLPDTAAEITDIANVLNADVAQDTFLGKNASEHNVKTVDLSNRHVIAFATHALVPGDLDGLDQPALALSSPSVTGDPEDGLLTMGEIMKLKLNADWVVLSACNTGASEGGGTEALTGLGRAFFYAGTRSVLASMWSVETTSARKLVSDMFRNQQSDSTIARAGALRKSMIGLIDDNLVDQGSGKVIASYAHPIFWAPFIMVGDPGK